MKRTKTLTVGITEFCAFLGTAVWAQFPSGSYFGTTRPQLENMRQATSSTSRSTSRGAAPGSNGAATPETLRLEALLIAVEKYSPDAGLGGDLSGCVNDVRALKERLDSNFSEAYARSEEYREKVTILSDADGGGVPTRARIVEALKKKARSDCDRLLVSFAGHGVRVGGKSFLCPSDAKALDPKSIDRKDEDAVRKVGNASNLIAVSDVLNLLKGAKAREVVLILDACRSNVDGSGVFVREFADLLKKSNGFKRRNGEFYVLTSCSVGESAREATAPDGETRGLFSYHFVDGLAGRADYAGCCDGSVTLVEAYNYAHSRVVAETNGAQTPELFMSNVGSVKPTPFVRVSAEEIFGFGRDGGFRIDALSDRDYLLYVGMIASDVTWEAEVGKLGERALGAVLDAAPNNALALSLRGGIRRASGDYVGALDDWTKCGQKFQLYVKSDRDDPAKPPRNDSESLTWRLRDGVGGEKTGVETSTYDLLTVAKIETDSKGRRWGRVVEKNNVPLNDDAGWIPLSATVWDWRMAARTVATTDLQPERRVVDYSTSSSGVAPGRNYISGGGGGSTPGPLYH